MAIDVARRLPSHFLADAIIDLDSGKVGAIITAAPDRVVPGVATELTALGLVRAVANGDPALVAAAAHDLWPDQLPHRRVPPTVLTVASEVGDLGKDRHHSSIGVLAEIVLVHQTLGLGLEDPQGPAAPARQLRELLRAEEQHEHSQNEADLHRSDLSEHATTLAPAPAVDPYDATRAPGRGMDGQSARRMSSTRSLASPKSMAEFSRKKSGFWTPA